MVRFLIIGVVLAVAFTLYSIVDVAMSDARRARGVSKSVWVLLVVVLPVIGGVLWFWIGRGSAVAPVAKAPDDDPRFTGTRMSERELDEHVRDLEARLRELDDEVFPGETAEAAESAEPAEPHEASDERLPGATAPGAEAPGAEAGDAAPGEAGAQGDAHPDDGGRPDDASAQQ